MHHRLCAALLAQGQAFQQPANGIGNGLFQGGETIELLAPGLPVAIVGHFARHPAQAGRFDAHQHRLLAHEDFVEGTADHARPGRFVQHFQEFRRPLGCGLRRPAASLLPTASAGLQNGQ